jgi:DNA gyrase/topoisomerase IV subunit B
LIDHDHLDIAQPPLYSVTRGKSEQEPHAAALQRAGRDEPGAAPGDDARRQRPLAAASQRQGDHEAKTIFDELMGDNVQPRRVFVEQNALAASMDV